VTRLSLIFLKSIVNLFIALSTLWTMAAFAAPLREDTELSLYRFFARENLASANVGSYKLNGQLFEPKMVGVLSLERRREEMTKADCVALLENLQQFSLNVMKQVSYISQSDFTSQAELIQKLLPEQVTFGEVTFPVSAEEVRANPEKYPKERISPRFDIERPSHVHIRQAGIWIVSGQTFDPDRENLRGLKKGPLETVPWQSFMSTQIPEGEIWDPTPYTIDINLNPMPWQLSSYLWESGKMELNKYGYANLDRKKYPLVWEVGRAAQTEPEQIDALFRMVTAVVAEEVEVTFQSKPEEAFLFVKSLEAKRTRLFKLMGFEELPEACPGPDRCVLVAPLTKMLKRYPVGSQSYRAAQIKKMLNDIPSTADAVHILRLIQAYRRADLDLISLGEGLVQKGPLVVHDFSQNFYYLMKVIGRDHELNDEQIKAFYGLSLNYFHDYDPNQATEDRIPIGQVTKIFREQNVVRISNLDPTLAMNDLYLPRVLTGLQKYLLERYESHRVNNGEELIHKIGTKFAIQTTSPLIYHCAKLLGCQEYSRAIFQDRPVYTCVFTMEQVDKIKERLPPLLLPDANPVAQGFWFFRKITANPLKF
jgi:hypothetical protein